MLGLPALSTVKVTSAFQSTLHTTSGTWAMQRCNTCSWKTHTKWTHAGKPVSSKGQLYEETNLSRGSFG